VEEWIKVRLNLALVHLRSRQLHDCIQGCDSVLQVSLSLYLFFFLFLSLSLSLSVSVSVSLSLSGSFSVCLSLSRCVCVSLSPYLAPFASLTLSSGPFPPPLVFSLPSIARPYQRRGGGLGSSTIFKNLLNPTPRRKWYLTTGRRFH